MKKSPLLLRTRALVLPNSRQKIFIKITEKKEVLCSKDEYLRIKREPKIYPAEIIYLPLGNMLLQFWIAQDFWGQFLDTTSKEFRESIDDISSHDIFFSTYPASKRRNFFCRVSNLKKSRMDKFAWEVCGECREGLLSRAYQAVLLSNTVREIKPVPHQTKDIDSLTLIRIVNPKGKDSLFNTSRIKKILQQDHRIMGILDYSNEERILYSPPFDAGHGIAEDVKFFMQEIHKLAVGAQQFPKLNLFITGTPTSFLGCILLSEFRISGFWSVYTLKKIDFSIKNNRIEYILNLECSDKRLCFSQERKTGADEVFLDKASFEQAKNDFEEMLKFKLRKSIPLWKKNGISIDFESQHVSIWFGKNKKKVKLNQYELEILVVLKEIFPNHITVENCILAIQRKPEIHPVWHKYLDMEETDKQGKMMRRHIERLKKKLSLPEHVFIQNMRGMGYGIVELPQ